MEAAAHGFFDIILKNFLKIYFTIVLRPCSIPQKRKQWKLIFYTGFYFNVLNSQNPSYSNPTPYDALFDTTPFPDKIYSIK